MKKVTTFIGSARRKTTYQAVQEFEKALNQYDRGIITLNSAKAASCALTRLLQRLLLKEYLWVIKYANILKVRERI